MSARLHAALLLSVAGLGLTFAAPATAHPEQSIPGPGADTQPVPPEEDVPADRFGFTESEQLQISSGMDDGNLTFRAALPTSPSMAHRFSLTAATPINGDGDAMPASLDALANGSRLTLSWGYFRLRPRVANAETRRMVAEARDICREATNNSPQCDISSEVIYNYDRRNWLRYLRMMTAGVTDVGLDATVGINDFEWVDPISFAPRKDRRTDWSIAAHATHFFRGQQVALTGSVSYQRAWEAVDEQQLCPPNVVDPATQCITARGAGPSRNENLLLSAGLRYRILRPDGTLGPLAIAPIVTYDAIDDIWGVDVPIYFVPGDNGDLTGGLRVSYRSDRDDEYAISAFVGTTFNFLQR